MTTKQSVSLIAVGWLLAAATLLYTGHWIATTNRYDGCFVAKFHEMPVYMCPVSGYEVPRQDGQEDV